MSFSYLDYLDSPTPENVKEVHKISGLIQPEAAAVAGIGLSTYKGWCSTPDKSNYRQPHTTTWNLYLYELEARRLGCENLLDYFNKNTCQSMQSIL